MILIGQRLYRAENLSGPPPDDGGGGGGGGTGSPTALTINGLALTINGVELTIS